MNGKTNASYLDLAALPTVGAALLSPRPAWVFSADGTAILWANVAGMRAFGATTIRDLRDRRLGGANPLVNQMARLSRTLPAAAPRLEILKLTTGVSLTTLPAACQRLNLADGGRAVFAMAMTDDRSAQSIGARAEALALALAGKDRLTAIVDADGEVVGASPDFHDRVPDEPDSGVRSVDFDDDGQTLTLVLVDDAAPTPAEGTEPDQPESDAAAPRADVSDLRALVDSPASIESNVVPLPGAAGKPPPGQERLAGHERDAFRRIAETLGDTYGLQIRSEPPARADNDGDGDNAETPVSDDGAGDAGAAREVGARSTGSRIKSGMSEAGERGSIAADKEDSGEAEAPRSFPSIPDQIGGPGAEDEGGADGPAKDPSPGSSPRSSRGSEPPSPARVESLQAAPVPDTAILDRLPIAIVVFREDETLYANNALVDLLGYDDRATFFAAGGREVLFAEDEPTQSLSLVPDPIGDPGAANRGGSSGSGSRIRSGMSGGGERGATSLTARTRDGDEIAVEARLQSVTWGGAPALMLSLREAVPVGDDRTDGSGSRPSRNANTETSVFGSGMSGEGGTNGDLAASNQVLGDAGPSSAPSVPDQIGDPGAAGRDRELGPGSPVKPGMSGEGLEDEEVSRGTLIEEIAAVQDRLGELETILDVATDGVIVLDAQGRIGNLNRSAEALFGVEAGDVLGRPFTELLAEESRKAARDYLDGLALNGVASVLNDGREVIGKVPQGGLIPLFMTMGRLGRSAKFCAVLRDITHWKNVEEELIAARRAAETANSLKSEFLAKISHEIRTPLNAIIGFSEVMMEERFGPIGTARYKDYLRDIHVSGAHLMSLINDLLDLSKIEAGKLELDLEPVTVNGVIQESVALMQPEANRARIIIRTSLAETMPRIVADQRSLRQILLNLLSNAIKFTPEGGQVIVSTTVEETGAVTLRVRDTGVGMSADEIETALMPFRQIATSGRERRDGTGLGLPLTKALVEANQATFAIESQVNHGTLVKVTFPKSTVVVG